jgi:hypothetical protein
MNSIKQNDAMKIRLVLVIAALAALLSAVKMYVDVSNENRRLTNNQAALMQDVRYYRTRDSLSAAYVEVLTLRHREFERFYGELATEAKNLKIKIKRLESASRTATETVYQVVPQWRDSIIYRYGSNITDTVRCAAYSDAWLTFDICGNRAHIAVTDTLVQLVHRVPRRFLFFRFGKKAVRKEVITKNPHTKIVYTEYIKLVR